MNAKQRKDFRRMTREFDVVFTYHYNDCSEHICRHCFSKNRDVHWDNCLQGSDWEVNSSNRFEDDDACRNCGLLFSEETYSLSL